jgi:hypothetical protein
VQRAQKNETSLRRVLILERELEVPKFELLLGPTSSATESEKRMARTLLLSSLQNPHDSVTNSATASQAAAPTLNAGDSGAASASPATLDARYPWPQAALHISDTSDAEAAATRDDEIQHRIENLASGDSTESE